MKLLRARTLPDALSALRDGDADTRLLAGGTDLMVEFDAGRTRPSLVLDIRGLGELRGVREEARGLRIFALTTCSELLASSAARAQADILVEAAREVGAVQIRNRATLGGNLGTASPAADLTPVLFALAARVRLVSERGARELAVEDFVTGYRVTTRAHDELIESVWIPPRPAAEARRFRKVGTRKAQSISKIVVALCAELEDGRVRALRAAAGSIAERTKRLAALERELAGRALDTATIAQAVRACVREDASPRSDVRSTESYRRQALARILTTLLASLPR